MNRVNSRNDFGNACRDSTINKQYIGLSAGFFLSIQYDAVRDAVLTCAQTLTGVSLISRTEPKTKKVEKKKN